MTKRVKRTVLMIVAVMVLMTAVLGSGAYCIGREAGICTCGEPRDHSTLE